MSRLGPVLKFKLDRYKEELTSVLILVYNNMRNFLGLVLIKLRNPGSMLGHSKFVNKLVLVLKYLVVSLVLSIFSD